MNRKKINPSKRIQEEEDFILFKIEKEKQYWQKAYMDEKMLCCKLKDKAWEMEKKRNEWSMVSILLGILAIVLIILIVI